VLVGFSNVVIAGFGAAAQGELQKIVPRIRRFSLSSSSRRTPGSILPCLQQVNPDPLFAKVPEMTAERQGA